MTPGQKCRRPGCQARLSGGTPRSGPTPGSPRTLRDERSGRRPRQATGCRGAGLCAEGTRHPRSHASAGAPASPPQPGASADPAAAPQPSPPLGPGTLRVAAGRSAGPTAGCPRGPRAADPGSGRPPPARPCPRQCPAPRGPARSSRPGPAVTAGRPKG